MNMLRNLLMMLMIFSAISLGAEPDEMLKNVRNKYESFRDFSAWITQGGSNPVFSGRIFLKNGNKFRLEMKNTTIVSDGSTLWNYSKKDKKVVIDEPRNGQGLPFSLNTVLNDYPSKSILSSSREGGSDILILTPKKESGLQFRSIKLWINKDNLVERILIENNKDLDFYISEYKLNQGIPDSRFSFDIPEGSRVIDLR